MAPRSDPPSPPSERPESGRQAREAAPGPPRLQVPDARTSAQVGTFVLLATGALYLGQGFFLPVVIAAILALLLSPLVALLARLRVPKKLGALVVLLAFVAALGAGVWRLSGPAAQWLESAPERLRELEDKLRELTEPVQEVTEATESVEELTALGRDDGVESVRLKQSRLSSALFSGTRKFVAQATVTVILLYFLLATGDIFLRKLVQVLPRLRDKKKAVTLAREIQDRIGHYLLVVTMINVVLAGVTGVALLLLGMPSPFLWGALAGVLNFVPYLGPILTHSIIAVVALLSFDSTAQALLMPLVSGSLNFVEGNLITPYVLGRQLLMNPVAIFVSLVFWGWLWGIPGTLLAVPLLAIFKIVCDHLEPLRPVGEFLGR